MTSCGFLDITNQHGTYRCILQHDAVCIAARIGAWIAQIMEMHRVCTKCQGIDCFCDTEVTGEA